MNAPQSLIESAEAAFSTGEPERAAALLERCLNSAAATLSSAQRAQALNDLAVIAAGGGRPVEAERCLLRAVAADPTHAPALENLVVWCADHGDPVQASHWAQRWVQAEPERAEAWTRLAALLTRRRRDADARVALQRALRLGADVHGELALLDARGSTAAPAPGSGPATVQRVLIVVDYFHPSVGGSERLAEAAGVALRERGLEVEIATRRLPGRSTLEHRGLRIREVDGDAAAELRRIVASGRHDAALVFSAPTSWPLVATLSLEPPRPRTVVVPCVNPENAAMLRARPDLMREYAALLGRADVVGYSSRGGEDVGLCEELGLAGVYVPNATERVVPAAEPPSGVDGEDPLLLMVGNMWPEKNHAGLLDALRGHAGEWRLGVIGGESPEAPAVAAEVRRLAAADPRVWLLGPARPDAVAAAMQRARILLLPSLAEATPLVLLEAMSRGLPWIATPACGAAHDHAGGLILPLSLFGAGIDFLLGDPDAAAALGSAGLDHWERCYTWDVLGPRYLRVMRGENVDALAAPASALAATEAVRAAFYDRRALMCT